MKDKFSSALLQSLSKGGWLIVVLAVACGILLMYLGGANGGSPDASVPATIEMRTREIEQKIKTLCESTKGAGETTVAVTLESSGEKVYSAFAGAGLSGDDPVCLSETAPQIKGVGIVCEGGGDPVVAERLISLISAAWNVPTSRIYVTCAEKNKYQS